MNLFSNIWKNFPLHSGFKSTKFCDCGFYLNAYCNSIRRASHCCSGLLFDVATTFASKAISESFSLRFSCEVCLREE